MVYVSVRESPGGEVSFPGTMMGSPRRMIAVLGGIKMGHNEDDWKRGTSVMKERLGE